MKKNWILIFSLFVYNSYSQITVDLSPPYDSPVHLIDNVLLGGGVTASNHNYQGDSIQIGYFDATNTSLGINTGIVMATGEVSVLDPLFTSTFPFLPNTVTDPDLLNVANSVPPLLPAPHTNSFTVSSINDVAILEFDFIPTSDSLSFNYVFGSEEYFAFENSQYNDVFGFFLSGPGISGPYSSPSYHPNGSINLATVPAFSPDLPITVSSVNDTTPFNQQYFIDNRPNQSNLSEVKGLTEVFTATATVIPGQTYHIRLAIADGSDNNYNSFIWLAGGSFLSSDFSPTVSTNISNNLCSSPSDITFSISQDPNEEDIDYAIVTTSGGSFDFSSLAVGDIIGNASTFLNVNSNSDENNIKYYSNDEGILSIMYHRFNESKYPSTNIQIKIFKKHMDIIKESGFDFNMTATKDAAKGFSGIVQELSPEAMIALGGIIGAGAVATKGGGSATKMALGVGLMGAAITAFFAGLLLGNTVLEGVGSVVGTDFSGFKSVIAGFDSVIKIYNDPRAKETKGLGGLTGGEKKSYLAVINGGKAMKIEKGKYKYKKQFTELYDGCESLMSKYKSKNIKVKWDDFAKHVAQYDKDCSK